MRRHRLPKPSRQQGGAAGSSEAASSGTAVSEAFSQWAAGYAEHLSNQEAVSSTPHMAAVSGDLAEEALDAAFQEVRRKRLELALADPVDVRDFSYIVRGGKWTAKKKKKAYDVIRGQAKGKEVKAWCKAEGLKKSASFDIAAYGEVEASKLATEWMRRMQWRYDCSIDCITGPEAAYTEDPRFIAWADSLPKKSRCHARIDEFRSVTSVVDDYESSDDSSDD